MEEFTIVSKEHFTNRTLRFPDSLWERVSVKAASHGISANKLVIQAVTFALDNMRREDAKR